MNLSRLSPGRRFATLGFFLLSLASPLANEAEILNAPPPKKEIQEVEKPDDSVITIDGHEANASRLLVKVKPTYNLAAMNQIHSATFDFLGMRQQNDFKLVPGLRVLEVKPDQQNGRFVDGRFATADDLKAHIAALESTGFYEYVEPDWQVHLMFDPSDDAYVSGQLWGLRNTGQSGGTAGIDINVVPAWQITTGSPEVVVGVIDSGIRYTHQDLIGNMWVNPGEIPGNGIDDNGSGFIDDVHGINAITMSGDPFDDNDHGTHVAGTIAATANDAGPHVGVAPNVRLMGLKFLNAFGSGFTSNAITCIDYAVANGADILNNSWGGGGESDSLRNAIRAASDAGVLFLASAGNAANNNDLNPSYPANYDVPNVLSVAAIDRTGALAWFSNYGAATVHIGAPGVSIFSCTARSDTSYGIFNGTSMAAPHVAGVAALIKSEFPSADMLEIKNRILSTASLIPGLTARVSTGGMVDAEAALVLIEDGNMQLQALPSGAIQEGKSVNFYISVTDLVPVTDATVTARIQGGADQVLRNDGVPPDLIANDQFYSGTFTVPTGQTTIILEVEAEAPGRNPTSRSFTYNVVLRPTNDDFANRIVIPPGFQRMTGTNRLASSEPGEPINPDVAGGSSVWWEWVAPEDAEVSINTFGSNFDTTLAIYRGTSLNALSFVGANNDTNGRQSQVSFNAIEGESYQIQVNGFYGDEGDIVLNHPLAAGEIAAPVIVTQPVNRNVVVGNPFSLSVSAAGVDPLEYQWFRNGDPIPGADEDTYNVEAATIEDDAGNYRVEVSNALGTATSNSALVIVDTVGLRPPNDDFDNAQALPSILGLVTGSNVGATGESFEPNHAGVSNPLSSVWYQWTAPIDGTFTVNTFGSDFDTTLAIYTGESLGALTEQGSNDDYRGLQSQVTIPVTAGTRYSIAVDGYSSSVGQIILSYQLNIGGTQVFNDNFADRIKIPLGGGVLTGRNMDATGEPGEPIHPPVAAPLASVWWSWTAPSKGPVNISTAGSNFDTTLAVYTGETLDRLTLVKANDDAIGLQSRVSFMAEAGVTYQIAVDGFRFSRGDIVLRVEFTPLAGLRGNVLLIEDQAGFGNARNILLNSGFNVEAKNYEFDNNYKNLTSPAYLSKFHFVVYGARGGGSGALMPQAVKDSLEHYIANGGHLLVTGHNGLGNPVDTRLAELVRALDPGKRSSNNPVWTVSSRDHPILNGIFGDFRGQLFAATGYNDDAVTPDADAGAIELIYTGLPRETGKLIFTKLPGAGGSVGFWNGGLAGQVANAQPDFTNVAKTQSIFMNYAAYATRIPAIAVEHAGEGMPHGAAELDYGAIALTTSSSRVVTVRNMGTATLTGISMSLQGDHASAFSMSAAAPSFLNPGASFNVSIAYAPSTEGQHSASLRILSSDPVRNTFHVELSGTAGGAPMDLYMAAATAAGLSGDDAAPDASPFGGPNNLIKYALNMDLSRADSSHMTSEGTSGLPWLRVVTTENQGRHWVCEYVRRKGSGLVYTPMRSHSLTAGTFAPITGTETVTDIDGLWERIVIEGEYDLAADPRDFAKLEIQIP